MPASIAEHRFDWGNDFVFWSRPMRKWFFITLIAACAAVFVGTHVSATQVQPNAPEQVRTRPVEIAGDAPLTIAVSNVGNFARGHSWHLSVNSAGQAELTIETVRKPT